MKVVISQPLFFPWVGLFEQIRLADVYVHYGDVQFTKGGFINRVQIKTAQGIKWLTVPLHGVSLGQAIDAVMIDDRQNWRLRHLSQLEQAYHQAPHRDEMLALVHAVYQQSVTTIGALSRATLAVCCSYFGLDRHTRFVESTDLKIAGSNSQRVLDIVRALDGHTYITGLGARHYLEHEKFEQAGIRVEYMNYQKTPYPQLHGDFMPYVSILDLVANRGRQGLENICSGTLHWKNYLLMA